MALGFVSPFRAVLAAHFQATWNRSAKEMGKSGRWAMLVMMGLVVLFGGLPAMGISAVAGYALGAHFDSTRAPLILGAVLALGAAMVGAISGIMGGTKALQWESYRVYPLSLRQIFAAELVAGIGDPWPTLAGLSALAMFLGLSAAHPALLPIALLLWLQTLLWMLLIQHFVGSLAAALMKRMKLALVVFGVFVWMLSVMASMLPKYSAPNPGAHLGTVLTPERIALVKQAGQVVLAGLGMLPSTHAARSLSDTLQGAWLPALLHQLTPILLLLIALALQARQMEREADPQALAVKASPQGAEKLWSFQSPAAGVAKLHWKTLMGSHLGRFGLLMPLMTVVLLKGPFSQIRGQAMWAIPGAFAYLALAGNQMQYNQFGLDGHGVKSLLLLPIRARDILLGKLGGLAMYQGLQAGLLLLLVALLMRPSPIELLAALCLGGCLFFVQMGLGHWTSSWLPRAMPRDSLKSGTMPMPVVFIGIGMGIVNFGFFGGTFMLCAWKAPGLLLPVMALLLSTCALVYRHLLPTFEAYFDARREKLLEALG
ncbi:MAG: hypothetical protein IPQ13_08435 [Holophagaceae bacterium]|nr:hypothetical protein [Holophagaceae bacterium]